MATKRKPAKKSTKSKKTGKVKPTKKSSQRRKASRKSTSRAARTKAAAKTKRPAKAIGGKKAGRAATRPARKKRAGPAAPVPSYELPESGLAGQSGDVQGLSNVEDADSESVAELIEEGNAFEAGVVEGVEEAGERAESEARSREVPEDDVPGEYRDEE